MRASGDIVAVTRAPGAPMRDLSSSFGRIVPWALARRRQLPKLSRAGIPMPAPPPRLFPVPLDDSRPRLPVPRHRFPLERARTDFHTGSGPNCPPKRRPFRKPLASSLSTGGAIALKKSRPTIPKPPARRNGACRTVSPIRPGSADPIPRWFDDDWLGVPTRVPGLQAEWLSEGAGDTAARGDCPEEKSAIRTASGDARPRFPEGMPLQAAC